MLVTDLKIGILIYNYSFSDFRNDCCVYKIKEILTNKIITNCLITKNIFEFEYNVIDGTVHADFCDFNIFLQLSKQYNGYIYNTVKNRYWRIIPENFI